MVKSYVNRDHVLAGDHIVGHKVVGPGVVEA
jgi:hypothetical protein